MDELKKLIDVLERKGKGYAAALLNYSDDKNLETRLYHLVKNDKLDDESLLAEQLYSTANKVGAYKMLKSRVKKKLYNQLIFLDTDNLKIVDKLGSIELKCRKILYLADALRWLDEPVLAEQQLKKAIKTAQNAHLIDFEIDGFEQLRILFAEKKSNRKKFDEYTSKLNKLYKIQEIEKEANKRFYDIRFDLKLGVEASHRFIEKLYCYTGDLQKYWKATNSNLVFKRYHQLKMMHYELHGDFASHIDYLKQTFSLYQDGKIHPLYFSVNFNKFLLIFAYLRNKQYHEGIIEAEILKNKLEEGSNNWFAHMENYFLLAIHSKDYDKAEIVLKEALMNKYLLDLKKIFLERWELFHDFFKYISGFTIIKFPKQKLKHIPQDKKGYYVWRLILDFILILEKKQPELIEREVDRIRKFITKYLVATEDARTKLFLKLLQVAGREYSDVKVCRRKGTYLFNKLQKTPAAGIAYAETEIMPYEHLWELILTKMENNK